MVKANGLCSTLLAGAALAISGFVSQEASAAGGPSVLAPHRAVYDIRLDKARAAAGVSELTGRMVYELTGNPCEGYTQNMRFVTQMANQEGKVTVNDMRSSSWEDGASRRLRFSSSQYRDEELSEAAQGDAERGDGHLRVELEKPQRKKVDVESKALFPIQHSLSLLAAARAGERVFVSDLYDGSEKGEKIYATTAALGAKLPPGYNRELPVAKNADVLDALNAWPVSLSYFEAGKDKDDAVPTYELAFIFFENGVSRKLLIDYGEFSIRGQLNELTFLDPGKCDRK